MKKHVEKCRYIHDLSLRKKAVRAVKHIVLSDARAQRCQSRNQDCTQKIKEYSVLLKPHTPVSYHGQKDQKAQDAGIYVKIYNIQISQDPLIHR